jgi:hypothetical protein
VLPLGEGVAGVVGVVLAPAPSTEQPPLSGVQLDSHVGAPLHVVWQPVVQPVVLHDCAPLHVCWHLLPEHATELCPVPLELSEQPPPGQSRVTDVAFVDDTEQPPPGHENEQFPPVHANEHCLPSPPAGLRAVGAGAGRSGHALGVDGGRAREREGRGEAHSEDDGGARGVAGDRGEGHGERHREVPFEAA